MQRKIWLSARDMAVIQEETDRCYPCETGGLLLGYRSGPGEVVVSNVLGPGPRARHGKAFFIPDHEYHELEVARLYELSGRLHIYLGDWHSHPEGQAQLSRRDVKTLRKIATERAARVKHPVMLIAVGSPASGWSFHGFQLTGVGCFRTYYEPIRSVRFEEAG